jgi:hypothetical protein
MAKIKKKTVLMASSMKEVPSSFWDWFFSETEWGGTNIIEAVCFDENDFNEKYLQTILLIAEKYKKYTYISNGVEYLEIENDL